MKRRTRLTSDQEQQTESNHIQEQTPVEFETAEELLRFDASHTAVPPSIAERLQKAIGAETDVERPWWKRWLSKK
jgi:hypothetical protein